MRLKLLNVEKDFSIKISHLTALRSMSRTQSLQIYHFLKKNALQVVQERFVFNLKVYMNSSFALPACSK